MAKHGGVSIADMPVRERAPVERVLLPIQDFMRLESLAGILLAVMTVVALVWANSPWAAAYHSLWHTEFTVGINGFTLRHDLHHWLNDGLMALFFLLVGLEIKREILVGELSRPRQAALPIAAAIGGMIVPAGIYAIITQGDPSAMRGWGVPMATDIAFAMGVLALLGRRIPLALQVFVVALAIVDDIGAVVVISIFYTESIAMNWLLFAGALLALLALCNWAGVRHPAPYGLLGLGLWLGIHESGVHATLAGVALAMTIPAHRRINSAFFVQRSRELLDKFDAGGVVTGGEATMDQQMVVRLLEEGCARVQTPLQRTEHVLAPWVVYVILPLFALANAGVQLAGDFVSTLGDSIAIGIVLGLVVGKPMGIVFCTWLAVRVGIADLPRGIGWRHITGASFLAGIGFTMALFIANLAFLTPEQLAVAKLGILVASMVAGLCGWALLRTLPMPSSPLPPVVKAPVAPPSPDWS